MSSHLVLPRAHGYTTGIWVFFRHGRGVTLIGMITVCVVYQGSMPGKQSCRISIRILCPRPFPYFIAKLHCPAVRFQVRICPYSVLAKCCWGQMHNWISEHETDKPLITVFRIFNRVPPLSRRTVLPCSFHGCLFICHASWCKIRFMGPYCSLVAGGWLFSPAYSRLFSAGKLVCGGFVWADNRRSQTEARSIDDLLGWRENLL